MLWISRFRLSMANGTPSPYNAHKAIRSGTENPATPIDAPAAVITEEIKRRQISLALGYVAAVRAR
jgi:hypothetical protein